MTQQQEDRSIVEYATLQAPDDTYWIRIRIDRETFRMVGPFHIREHRDRAYEDLMEMSRSLGAIDLPLHEQ